MKIVSLFSGAGGMDLGFIKAGHNVIWANDSFYDASETYKLNIGDHIICKKIEDIPSISIPDCDMIIGGFPCQGFSVANVNRSMSDSRNKLYLEMLRVIKDKKPKYFLAENVKGILSLGKGSVIRMIVSDFESIGYQVKYFLLNAADYGVPQRRERVFIVGIRNDINDKLDFPPAATHGDPSRKLFYKLKPWVSIGEALRNLPEPDKAKGISNHTCSKYKLRFNNYLGHRYVDPLKPAPTITARGDERGGVVVIHHPNNKRRMTARELAVAQSFPVKFKFFGSQSSAYRQIGNAVPPLLAYKIAKKFR